MDASFNNYDPGSGTPPPLLAGRDDLVNIAQVALIRAKAGRSAKSFVATGLRGVGKTVVLNKVQDLAEAQGYQTALIEAVEDVLLVKLLVPQVRRILLKLDRRAATQDVVRRGIRVLRGLASAFKVQIGDIELGIEPKAGIGDSGDLATDLPDYS